MTELNLLQSAIAAIPIGLGCIRLGKGGEKWLLTGLIQWFVCYQMTVITKTHSNIWYYSIGLITGITAITTAIRAGQQTQKSERLYSTSREACLLIIPIAIACYLINGGFYIDWSPFDSAYYFNHNYTTDQLACGIARGTLTKYTLDCTWVYALAQFLLGLKESTSILDARIFVAASAGLLSLSTGILIHRFVGTIWPAMLGQSLILALLGWHEFSFIQSNGTNGYMIGLSCCYLSVAAVTTKETWLNKRAFSRILKTCVLLASIWAAYMAHAQTSYTWLGLAAGIVAAAFMKEYGILYFFGTFIAISGSALIATNFIGLEWFEPNSRDWTALVNAQEIIKIKLPGRDFIGYVPWVRPFSDPAYGFWLTLLIATTAAIILMTGKKKVSNRKGSSVVASGFLLSPLIILALWTAPPWSELYIRSVPGEFNTILRSIWGASTWIALPIAISLILYKIKLKLQRRLFIASTSLLLIPIFVPLRWEGKENILRAKTVHLFERSERYGGLDVEKELIPVLRQYCNQFPNGPDKPAMLADGYIIEFTWARTCTTATPLGKMNLFNKLYLNVDSPIQNQPINKSRAEHVVSELSRTNASIVVLRKGYPRYTSAVAQRSGLWSSDIAEQMADTNIRLIDSKLLREAGFKLLTQTKSFMIYTKIPWQRQIANGHHPSLDADI